ncbi:MAG: ABC transporter substrate-binding protein [Desulfobacteraceae bacterium]|nr:ABC transporter substrate-binding protein [Desulfobacteraceae bacterium]
MKKVRSEFLTMAALILAGLILHTPAYADVILGQSCALSGPTSFLGIEMNRGAMAYFDKYASDITLKALDDKYEPDRCIKNTNQLIQEDVTALFAYVGTPTSKVAIPLATKNKKIFLGAFTGAGFLSDHKTNPFSFSVRASYDAEIENMVLRLKKDLGISKISLFVQKDAFGMVGVKGAVKAVKKLGGVEIIPEVPEIPTVSAPKEEWKKFWRFVPNYRRNTVSVGQGARQVMGNRPEAVIMVGAYRPCAAVISLWKRLQFDAVFVNISFVGSKALAQACRGDVKNVLISQVVPNPWDPRVAVVREYQQALGDKKYGFVSLEGYISAKIMHTAIKNAGASVDSETLKSKMEAMSKYDIGGLTVSFGPEDHRGLNAVYLTKIEAVQKDGGKFDYKFKYIDKIVRE